MTTSANPATRPTSATRTARRVWRQVSERRYWIAAAVLWIAMLLQTLYGEWQGDFWEHSAVVRELAAHPFSPSHPLLNVNVPHPFFSPYLLLVAGVARLFALSPISALALAGMANLALLLVGLWLFIRALFDRYPHIVSFYALLLILFAWPASAWNWSGFFHFRALGYVLPYPSTFALALTFVILAVFANALNGRHGLRWVTTAVLTTIVLLTHPTTAVITFIGIGALALAATRASRFRSWAVAAGVLAVAVLLAFLWPYYSFWDLLTYNDPEFHSSSYVLYRDIRDLWPTLLLLPLAVITFIVRLRRNRLDALVVMATTAVLVYLFGFVTGQYGFGRLIAFIAMIIQIGAAAFGARWEMTQRRQLAWIAPMLLLLFVGIVAFNGATRHALVKMVRGAQGQHADYAEYEAIGTAVSPDAVVLTDLETGWMVPTFAGKVLASRHPAHWVSDHEQRRADLAQFFTADTPTTTRQALVDAYAVDYVLVNTRAVTDPEPYLALGELTAVTDQFLLIAVTSRP